MARLFSYGTLQQDDVQQATFGRRLHGRRDQLAGYEPSVVAIDDPLVVDELGRTHHANVIFTGRPDSRVNGTVLELTADELFAADGYERRFAYTRTQATLVSGGDVWIYVDTRTHMARLAIEWDRAMVTNDADAIGRFMAGEWVIVGSDGSITDKASFLALIRSGELTHDVMETHDLDARVYGDAAVVIARGISGGHFRGQSFHFVERVSSVFVRQGGDWLCASTHLSELK
jgi:ketosteroid isomerase-like protein